MKKLTIFLATILMIGFSSSCKKDSTTTDPIVASSEDNAEVSAMFDDIDAEADNASQLKDMMVSDSGGTRTVLITDTANMKKIVITFDQYVNSKNTRIKNGKIIVLVSGKYANLASPFKKTITFENFTINGNKVEGTRVIERDATDSLKFNITLTNGKVTFYEDGTTYTRTLENRVRQWTQGSNTPYWIWDDEYTITGSASGTNRRGEAYTHAITTPLVVSTDCPWIKSGVIEFTVTTASGPKSASINYGTGTCDNIAEVTANGKTYDIKLKGARK